MKQKNKFHSRLFIFYLLSALIAVPLYTQTEKDSALDKKVRKFLDSHEGKWRDMNIPERDGKFMYDLIIKHDYKQALEIGTSTGHSAIWIAWALSKTGGKLITIEIDEDRYKEAAANFKEAGLSDYIDARLADAHELVPKLEGPFDFVFSDADKDWYKNYFIAVSPKMKIGGCYISHNVSRRGRYMQDYVKFLTDLPDFETTIEDDATSGISISYKKEISKKGNDR